MRTKQWLRCQSLQIILAIISNYRAMLYLFYSLSNQDDTRAVATVSST